MKFPLVEIPFFVGAVGLLVGQILMAWGDVGKGGRKIMLGGVVVSTIGALLLLLGALSLCYYFYP
jgi:hypothetical protein